jgi:hypothetical protein
MDPEVERAPLLGSDEIMLDPDTASAAAFMYDYSHGTPRASIKRGSPTKPSAKHTTFPIDNLNIDTDILSPKSPSCGLFDIQKIAHHLDLDNKRTSTTKHTFWSHSLGCVHASGFDSFNLKSLCNDTKEVLESGVFWINFHQPSLQEIDDISRAFNIHPLTKEDIQTPDTREKCEVFQNYYFVVIKSFEGDIFKSTYLSAIPVYIVIFASFVLSVRISDFSFHSLTTHMPAIWFDELNSFLNMDYQ